MNVIGSLAKQFEKNIQAQLQDIVFIQRIYDFSNFMGISNIADFLAYKYPYMYILEAKTTAGSSMPLVNISEYQYTNMLAATQFTGIKAYFIIWYYDKDITRVVPVEVIRDIKETNKKSIRFDYKDERIIELYGEKRKKYFSYDWTPLFKEVAYVSKRGTTKTYRGKFSGVTKDRYRNSKQIHQYNRRICGQYAKSITRRSR